MISSEQFKAIKAIVLDVDGVLTDGRMGYGAEDEIKFFHVRDGHGLKMAQRCGLKLGIISGRSAAANRRRAKELGFDFIYENCHDKLAAFESMLQEQQLKPEECLYIGDDVIDMPILRRAGIGVTVADAPPYMDEVVQWRTKNPGGKGAVREVIDTLLQAMGVWDTMMERYRK